MAPTATSDPTGTGTAKSPQSISEKRYDDPRSPRLIALMPLQRPLVFSYT